MIKKKKTFKDKKKKGEEGREEVRTKLEREVTDKNPHGRAGVGD